MHLHHHQGVLTFYSAKLIETVKVTNPVNLYIQSPSPQYRRPVIILVDRAQCFKVRTLSSPITIAYITVLDYGGSDG